MKPQRTKAKRVRDIWETEIGRDSWQVPSLDFIYVTDKFEVGDKVRVTVTLLDRPKPFVTVRYGKLTPAQKKRNYEQSMRYAEGKHGRS